MTRVESLFGYRSRVHVHSCACFASGKPIVSALAPPHSFRGFLHKAHDGNIRTFVLNEALCSLGDECAHFTFTLWAHILHIPVPVCGLRRQALYAPSHSAARVFFYTFTHTLRHALHDARSDFTPLVRLDISIARRDESSSSSSASRVRVTQSPNWSRRSRRRRRRRSRNSASIFHSGKPAQKPFTRVARCCCFVCRARSLVCVGTYTQPQMGGGIIPVLEPRKSH